MEIPPLLAIRHVETTNCLEVAEPPAKHPELWDCNSQDLQFYQTSHMQILDFKMTILDWESIVRVCRF